MAKQPMKDVIVLLPGILGSVLERDGKEVWAPSPGAIGRALWKLGRNLNDLALVDDPWQQDDLGDGVTATRLMPDIHMIPGLWGIDGYSDISPMIRSTFDVTDGVNYFEFPYDWRRDNRVAARRLKDLADRALHARRKDVPDAKVVLVGHSMGGIVSRYYLECLDGWRDTRALITFGTPYRGSHERSRLPRQRLREEGGTAEAGRSDDPAPLAHVGVPVATEVPVHRSG